MAVAAGAWPALAAGAVYALHALLFRGWIVDDAGISFTYARNLAEGFGLVSQPGREPVEGYSNFLWVCILALAHLAHLFHPIVTPKLISLAIVVATFVLLDRTIRRARPGAGWASLAALILLACNTPFVVWTCSGMENALYALLLAALLAGTVAANAGTALSNRAACALGLAAAGAAMTRPEGVLFAAAPLCLWGFGWIIARKRPERPAVRSAVTYASTFVAAYGGFILFRLLYFKELMPNTYYAKGGPTAGDLFGALTLQPYMVGRLTFLMKGAAGVLGGLLGISVVCMCGCLIAMRKFSRHHGAWVLFTGLGALSYLLMPPDWMGEHRFATAFMTFLYGLVMLMGLDVLDGWTHTGMRVRVAALLGTLAIQFAIFAPRSRAFAERPTYPFMEVGERFGKRFNRYSERLGIEDGSILLHDLGGTLYYSRLKVYDLSGLCDRTIARTFEPRLPEFYDYIFEEVRPTFIHAFVGWSVRADLDRDPRFRDNYVALYEYPEHTVERTRRVIYSGSYVRRDAVRGRNSILEDIKGEMEEAHRRTGAEGN